MEAEIGDDMEVEAVFEDFWGKNSKVGERSALVDGAQRHLQLWGGCM